MSMAATLFAAPSSLLLAAGEEISFDQQKQPKDWDMLNLDPNNCGCKGAEWNIDYELDETFSSEIYKGNEITQGLIARDFGFAIPPKALVTGISVRLVMSAKGEGGVTWTAQLLKNGLPAGTKKTTSTLRNAGSSFEFGSAYNTWDMDFTADEINSPDFGVMINAWASYPGRVTAKIHRIEIIAHYIRRGFENNTCDNKRHRAVDAAPLQHAKSCWA